MDIQKLMADTTNLIRSTNDDDILDSLKASIIKWGQEGILMDDDKVAFIKANAHTFSDAEIASFTRIYRDLLHEQREINRRFRAANATVRNHDLDAFVELLERCCKNFEEIIKATGKAL